MTSARRAATLLLLIPMAGCPFVSQTELALRLDADGDGHAPEDLGGDDCDDHDASVGAPFSVWRDSDEDGFGDPAKTKLVCVVPERYVANDGDCNDADPDVRDPRIWYADADLDGWGDAAGETVATCDTPDADAFNGWTLDATDCDDHNGNVNPAAVEVCDEDEDADCDGIPGNCALADLLAGFAEGGQLGTTIAFAGDLHEDGVPEVAVGVPGVGAVYLVPASLTGDDLPTAADGAFDGTWFAGEVADAAFGAAIAVSGDWVWIGAPGEDTVYVARGPFPLERWEDLDVAFRSETGDTSAGSALAVGDYDGDGVEDLLVGAPSASEGCGLVTIITAGGDVTLHDQCTAEQNVDGALGSTVVFGDFDGDGRMDPVIGAPAMDWGRDEAGSVYVYLDHAASDVDLLHERTTRWDGEVGGDAAGSALATGDLNGDGYDDLVVGAPDADTSERDAGAIYVIFGTYGGDLFYGSLGLSDLEIWGAVDDTSGGGRAGAAVSIPGDVDGDGIADLAVGAPAFGDATLGAGAGAVYLLSGVNLRPGSYELNSSDEGNRPSIDTDRLVCPAEDCAAGTSLVGIGDIDGDGRGDLVTGAPGWDDLAGAISVVFGSEVPVPGGSAP